MKIFRLFLVLYILFLFSGCRDKSKTDDFKKAKTFSPERIIKIREEKIFDTFQFPGSIRPKTESKIESQIQAQVLNVHVSHGSKVKKGDLLITLDNRSFKLRLSRAKESLKEASAFESQSKEEIKRTKAVFDQAKSNYIRIKKYYETEAATKIDLERANALYLQAMANLKKSKKGLVAAKAGIRSAKEQVKEAYVSLGFTKIKAPESGKILRKMTEPGDLALPGRPLLIIQTKGGLILEAFVGEGFIKNTSKGDEVVVVIDSLEKEVKGIIDEVVPYADINTRTFLVKVTIPHLNGVYPGMYGRLFIPAMERKAVVIPGDFLLKTGQLEMVYLKSGDDWLKVHIKTGIKTDKGIEVLSGLIAGDKVGIR